MRKLALTLVPLMLWRSTSVFALGVGDIELHSALNQPFNAEIRLLSVTPAELQGLRVALAPESAFASAGVERAGLLNQLRFKVVQKPDGSHVIKVTSTQPIREPFLDFLVEVNWPSGRFVREYTVLLDFPVLEGGAPAPLDAPVSTAASVAEPPPVSAGLADIAEEVTEAVAPPLVAPAPIVAQSKPARRALAPIVAAAGDGGYGPTQRADTLWEVALKMRPDDSVSVSQVMVALAKNNPQAFFGNNVNNLMAGYILRLPPLDEVRAISQAAAVREIAAQYQQWLNVQKGGAPASPAPQAAGQGADSAARSQKSTEGAQLKLITPDTGKAGAAAAGNGKTPAGDTSDVAALRKELAMALEAVDANRQENAELRARMAQLEKQLLSMQRLLELKDPGFAALQNKQAAAAKPPAATTQPATSPATPRTSPTPPVAAAPKQPVAPAEPQETDLLGAVMGNPQQLGVLLGGFLLISALAWAFVRRRRQAAIDTADESFAKLLKSSSVTSSEDEATKAGQETAVPTPADQDLPKTALVLSSAQTDEDLIDPIAEADVYLAYRRYEQAAELIKDALRNDPARTDLSLKLLEIYHLAKNAEAFETQAEAFYAELGGDSNHPLWVKTVEMGKQIAPTHPLFARAAGTAMASAAATDLGEAIMDNSADSKNAPEIMSDVSMADSENIFSLDVPIEHMTTAAVEERPAITDNSMEFDMGASVPGAEAPALEETSAASNVMEFDLTLSPATQDNNDAQDTSPRHGLLSTLDDAPLDGDLEFTPKDAQPARAETLVTEDFNLDSAAIAAFDGTAPDDAAAPTEGTEDGLFAGIDMVGTKLDLAKAYIDMEDKEGAKMLLSEVLAEGNDPQKNEAQDLMRQIA